MTNIQNSLFSYNLQSLVEDAKRDQDDWVNATKWCENFDKQWAQISKQPNFKKYMKALQTKLFAHSDKISLYEIKGKPKQTWVHPLVAIKLAEELSPEFDVFVKETFKRYLDGDITLADDIIQRTKSEQELIWLEKRLKGKITRKAFTNELKNHGVTGVGYAMNTDAIYEGILGKTAKELKEERNIERKDTARDNMSAIELAAVDLVEMLSIQRMQKADVTGNKETAALSRLTADKLRVAITLD
jgi:hypothetical protein